LLEYGPQGPLGDVSPGYGGYAPAGFWVSGAPWSFFPAIPGVGRMIVKNRDKKQGLGLSDRRSAAAASLKIPKFEKLIFSK
jgi:hypothetical protein